MKAFTIVATNLERQLYIDFSFSEQQWEDAQVPPDFYNLAPGPKYCTQDAAGVFFSLFLDSIIRGDVEDAAAKERMNPEDAAPEAEKREGLEIWYLNDLYHFVEFDFKNTGSGVWKFKSKRAIPKAPDSNVEFLLL